MTQRALHGTAEEVLGSVRPGDHLFVHPEGARTVAVPIDQAFGFTTDRVMRAIGAECCRLAAAGPLTIDLSRVQIIDVSATQLLVNLNAIRAQAGDELLLTNVCARVEEELRSIQRGWVPAMGSFGRIVRDEPTARCGGDELSENTMPAFQVIRTAQAGSNS